MAYVTGPGARRPLAVPSRAPQVAVPSSAPDVAGSFAASASCPPAAPGPRAPAGPPPGHLWSAEPPPPPPPPLERCGAPSRGRRRRGGSLGQRGSAREERSRSPAAAGRHSDGREPGPDPDEEWFLEQLSKQIVQTCRYRRCACLSAVGSACGPCRNWEAAGLEPVPADALGENCSWFKVRLFADLWCLNCCIGPLTSPFTSGPPFSTFAVLSLALSLRIKIGLAMAFAISRLSAGSCRRECVSRCRLFETRARVHERRERRDWAAWFHPPASRGVASAAPLSASGIALDWDFAQECFHTLVFDDPGELVESYIAEVEAECVDVLGKTPLDERAQACSALMVAVSMLCRTDFARRISWSSCS